METLVQRLLSIKTHVVKCNNKKITFISVDYSDPEKIPIITEVNTHDSELYYDVNYYFRSYYLKDVGTTVILCKKFANDSDEKLSLIHEFIGNHQYVNEKPI